MFLRHHRTTFRCSRSSHLEKPERSNRELAELIRRIRARPGAARS
jgi:hypothetical protein